MADKSYAQRPTIPSDDELTGAEADPQTEAPPENVSPIPQISVADLDGEGQRRMTGQIPPALANAMRQSRGSEPASVAPTPDKRGDGESAGSALDKVRNKLKRHCMYEEVQLPSRGKFYEGQGIPDTLHIRPMTGDEEKILSNANIAAKKGRALEMLLGQCIQERINPADLIVEDQTHLTIWLRAITYTNHYEVEIGCPSCSAKFPQDIDLDEGLEVEYCPDDFGPESLKGTLPVSGLEFGYEFPTGRIEREVTERRDGRVKNYGGAVEDDTPAYRMARLLTHVDELDETDDLLALISDLPAGDVNYIRNLIGDPPFGVDTKIGLLCPNCSHEFEVGLPLDLGFFFPKVRKER